MLLFRVAVGGWHWGGLRAWWAKRCGKDGGGKERDPAGAVSHLKSN